MFSPQLPVAGGEANDTTADGGGIRRGPVVEFETNDRDAPLNRESGGSDAITGGMCAVRSRQTCASAIEFGQAGYWLEKVNQTIFPPTAGFSPHADDAAD